MRFLLASTYLCSAVALIGCATEPPAASGAAAAATSSAATAKTSSAATAKTSSAATAKTSSFAATATNGAAKSDAPPGWKSVLVFAPAGWSAHVDAEEKDHLARTYSAPTGTCRVQVDLWAGLPPDPGGLMSIASKRTTTVDGRTVEVVTTSVFQGAAVVVDAVYVNDGTSYARAVFRDCAAELEDRALAQARLSPSVRGD